MGYKETEAWTQHEENFSTLLESLSQAENNDNTTEEIKLSSLEAKSKSSKARVHYKKFTRGKDLSRYSEKDLANVFGKKTLKREKRDELKIEENHQEETNDKNEHSFGIETTNRGSMVDYFKNKMRNFEVDRKHESESESEMTFGFGFKQNDEVDQPKKKKKKKHVEADLKITEEINVSEDVGKKKKKSKKVKCENVEGNEVLIENDTTIEVVAKKKKKKKLEVDEF